MFNPVVLESTAEAVSDVLFRAGSGNWLQGTEYLVGLSHYVHFMLHPFVESTDTCDELMTTSVFWNNSCIQTMPAPFTNPYTASL